MCKRYVFKINVELVCKIVYNNPDILLEMI